MSLSFNQLDGLFVTYFTGPLGSDDGNSWEDASEGYNSLSRSPFSQLSEFPSDFVLLSFRLLPQELVPRITLIGMEI